ncbi:MAG: hypothetical protein CTY31_14000 [Hyphomicrobium sp.]|nr:MAG: hypothetical protein CTY31_14000 [Hyphomicrobium sp.]
MIAHHTRRGLHSGHFHIVVSSRRNSSAGAIIFHYAADTHISHNPANLYRDTRDFNGQATAIRNYELSHKAQVLSGWTLQPDFQNIWNPGGNGLDPSDPADPGDISISTAEKKTANVFIYDFHGPTVLMPFLKPRH